MNIHNKILIATVLLLLSPSVRSQQTDSAAAPVGILTLEECRARAMEANKGLKRAEAKRTEMEALERVAMWQMLPKVSANGVYNWMERSVELLSDEQKARLQNMGTSVQQGIGTALGEEFSGLPFGGDWIAQRLTNLIANENFVSTINGVGDHLVSSLETDTRNIMAGTVTVTQPVYMGGKLAAMHRTAALMSKLSDVEYDKEREEILIGVEEAYWMVVSVKHKKELAEQYAALLDTLNRNVEDMVEAEVATRGDLTKVRVKLNEAQMSLTKATNGLALAKMLLAQRCGMPLDTVFDVAGSAEWDLEDDEAPTVDHSLLTPVNMDDVWNKRKEMHMLRISDSVSREGVKAARSTLLPNVVVTGGYMVSNPNLFNGFQNEFGGTFLAGVAVNVPILHPGGMYAVKAAKAKRTEVAWQMAEAREMIELQVNKVRYELELAYKKLAEAESDLANAEENLKLADESFKAGMVGSSDLMAAQTAWLKAKGEVLDARIEIEMGRVYLHQAMGY